MRRVDWVTGSDMSPPAGETAPTMETAPCSPARVVTRPRPFIEGRQAGGQIRRITLFGRHFFQPGEISRKASAQRLVESAIMATP